MPFPPEKVPPQALRASISLPLQTQTQVIGVLHVNVSETRDFSREEINLLTAVSEIAASALGRAMLLETLEQRVATRTHELAEANERLQELDRLKSKFVSDVSHELRTPSPICRFTWICCSTAVRIGGANMKPSCASR